MKYFIPTCSMRKASTFVVALLLLVGVSACKKENGTLGDGQTVVRIQMVGTESDEGNNPLSKEASSKKKGTAVVGPQIFNLPFGDDMMVTATLEEVDRTGNQVTNETVVKRASAAGNGNKAVIKNNPLGNGIKYGILVYDKDGDLFAEKEYTHGNGYSSEQDTIGGLTAGETYTFVGYSINSTTDLPVITNKATLAAVETALTDQDLMIFRDEKQIVNGSNTLQVVLKHKFIEILPSISIATSVNPNTGVPVWGGQIDAIGGMSLNGTYAQGAVKIADNTYSFSSNTIDKAVTLPAIPTGGTTLLTATQPILLISPATTTGNFTINGLTINGIVDDLDFNEMKLEPGKKYNLKLKFNSPCIEQVDADGVWIPNHNTTQWTEWLNLPDADFGFVFDIHTLDNSVNIEVNGQPLFLTERIYQYRTRNSLSAQWPTTWTTVTSNTQSRSTSTSIGNVAFPIHWTERGGDLDFQMSAKINEDYGINNVQFVDDGDIYGGPADNEGGSGNIPPLWYAQWSGTGGESTPNPAGPFIQIQIMPDGSSQRVRVTGRKTFTGERQPMEIIAEQTSMSMYFTWNRTNDPIQTYNPAAARREERAILRTRVNPAVTWNSTGGNDVRISQRIVGRTWMYVEGYGVKRTVCNP